MSRVVIYGASDDLIELEGDIYDEFNHYSSKPAVLSFDDGTTVSAVYKSTWTLEVLNVGEGSTVEHHTAIDDESGDDADGCPDYSDKVILVGEFTTVSLTYP